MRTNLEAGEVTYRDVVDILPYCNEIVMADERKGLCLPYREYLKVCIQGYKDNGIDVQPLHEALKYTRDNSQQGQ